MSRLIDADKLTKRFKQLKGLDTLANMFISDVIKEIKNQPTVEAASKWIPCSERLPENYETVNITWVNRKPEQYYEHIKYKPFTGTAIYHYGKWCWYSCICEDYLREYGDSLCDRMDKDIEVIAWQPLPEPYKGE